MLNFNLFPWYVSIGVNGQVRRPAQCLGELPIHDLFLALDVASEKLGMRVEFGERLYRSLGISLAMAKSDSRTWLLLRGDEIPLSLIFGDNSEVGGK